MVIIKKWSQFHWSSYFLTCLPMESNKPFDIELFIHSQQQKTTMCVTQWACHEQNIYVEHIKKMAYIIIHSHHISSKM